MDHTGMTQNHDGTRAKMRHSGTRNLFDYWTGLRAGRAAPYKSEVSAQGVGRALASNTFVLESLGGANMRFRLSGSSLYDIFGIELRGMSALSIMDRDSRERFGALIDAGLKRPCVCLAHLAASTRRGEMREIELIMAPLRSDFDEMNRMLGSVHVIGDEAIESEPRRCAIQSAFTFNFDHGDHNLLDNAMPGFAEAQTPFEMGARPKLTAIEGGRITPTERRRDHLKIVKTS